MTHRPRLLVVDDHHDGAESTALLLALAGYNLRFVLSGPAAFVVLHAWTPEFAVLDINMPGKDGFAVARQMRQDCQTRDVVIVAFTAQDEAAIRTEGIAAGFDGYCQKGDAPDALPGLLGRMVSGETGDIGAC